MNHLYNTKINTDKITLSLSHHEMLTVKTNVCCHLSFLKRASKNIHVHSTPPVYNLQILVDDPTDISFFKQLVVALFVRQIIH